MFTIDIAALGPGLHAETFEPSAESLGLDSERFKDVEVDARFDVSERRILVSLHAHATATLECDRTLKQFDQLVDGSYDLLFAPPEFVGADEDAFDEVRVLEPNDHEIDLTAVLRDTILLAIPARCVAPGADDEDIPTTFGARDEEDATDPRWEALKKLKSGAT